MGPLSPLRSATRELPQVSMFFGEILKVSEYVSTQLLTLLERLLGSGTGLINATSFVVVLVFCCFVFVCVLF